MSAQGARYTAPIRFGGKQHYLGMYDFAEDAARAYDAAACGHYGNAAVLNFPEEGEAGVRFDQQPDRASPLTPRGGRCGIAPR